IGWLNEIALDQPLAATMPFFYSLFIKQLPSTSSRPTHMGAISCAISSHSLAKLTFSVISST
ncbi:hypothetical protein K8D10_22275, partial [Aeromonas veronii]|uniref:hypothetical protein n=1 Tax=Aeromonas veronii TaxID=654 RepID=UPI00207CB022